MFAFFLTPLGRKIAIYGAIAIAFFVALRIYGNRQYYAGREEEKVASAKLLEESANKARDAARAELTVERQAVAADRATLDQARIQFAGERRQVDTQIRSRLDAIATVAKGQADKVLQLQDPELPDAIRRAVKELSVEQ